MPGLIDLAIVGFLPAIAALIVLVLGWKLTGRSGVAWTAGIVVGYIVAAIAQKARALGVADSALRLIHPQEAIDWLPMFVLAAGMVQAVDGLLGAHRVGRMVPAVFVALLGAALPLRLLWGGKFLPSAEIRAAGFAKEAWTYGKAALVFAALGVVVAFIWFVWRRYDRPRPPWLRGALLMAVVLGAAVTALLTGSITYGLAIGSLAAVLGGCVLGGVISKLPTGPEAASAPILIALEGLLVVATTYSEMRVAYAACLALVAMFIVYRPAPDGGLQNPPPA